MAHAGTPAGLIATSVFQKLALAEMAALGATGLPMITIEHPLGGEATDGVARRVAQVMEQMARLFGQG